MPQWELQHLETHYIDQVSILYLKMSLLYTEKQLVPSPKILLLSEVYDPIDWCKTKYLKNVWNLYQWHVSTRCVRNLDSLLKVGYWLLYSLENLSVLVVFSKRHVHVHAALFISAYSVNAFVYSTVNARGFRWPRPGDRSDISHTRATPRRFLRSVSEQPTGKNPAKYLWNVLYCFYSSLVVPSVQIMQHAMSSFYKNNHDHLAHVDTLWTLIVLGTKLQNWRIELYIKSVVLWLSRVASLDILSSCSQTFQS